ncbi:phosphoglycerate mutase family protein [Colletotrichum tofieldiae]|uniref:Phosphoglycerate mutase family protein n=1 Tax=Colletotrichum tofieldiae TaxID=708197 RepID=A0A161VE57_9PEZI|nr:phosphoglycerate mutase family protein [Colletotrichum tofieldiae]GKT96943.1 phosphoglycerate mutase family protein [Colletotrichum tofieldiae]
MAQASALIEKFPNPASTTVVLTSPLTRTLQTTIAGFPHIIRKDAVGATQLIIDPDLQERSDLSCVTGSSRAVLEAFPGLDFGGLVNEWFIKEGSYAADDVVVAERAQRFRDRLRDIVAALAKDGEESGKRQERNVVVVTHGMFMKSLAEDESIDLPKAGWKSFTMGNRGNGRAVLIPL